MNGLAWSFIKVISGFFVSLPILALEIDYLSQAIILMITFAIFYYVLDLMKEKIENGRNIKKN